MNKGAVAAVVAFVISNGLVAWALAETISTDNLTSARGLVEARSGACYALAAALTPGKDLGPMTDNGPVDSPDTRIERARNFGRALNLALVQHPDANGLLAEVALLDKEGKYTVLDFDSKQKNADGSSKGLTNPVC